MFTRHTRFFNFGMYQKKDAVDIMGDWNENNKKIDEALQSLKGTTSGVKNEMKTIQTEITTMTKISIHAPAKGATVSNCFITNIYFLISIHAPAKGATEFTQWQTGESVISIHAPAKGATIR